MPILKDDTGEKANTCASKWNITMFHWPELPEQLKIEKFIDVALKYKSVEFISFMESYQVNPNYDYYREKETSFPNNIFLGLNSYYNLN